jgi:hypothetical protein
VRIAMLEVFAALIHKILATNPSETAYSQMMSFFNILEERFRDSKAFVRSKLLQILAKLAELSSQKFSYLLALFSTLFHRITLINT